ncbi:MAG: threonine aldolase family protein [Myxococcota bacterium]
MTVRQWAADLVSDTVTRPTPSMRRAMAEAEVGDEQRGDDPTVLALERRVASLLGMDAAVFVPSATMANQIAVQLHTRPGDEVICDRTAHVYNHEGGGMAGNAGAQCRPLSAERGIFTPAQLDEALRVDNEVYPRSALVVVENTSNGGGGVPWTPEESRAVVQHAQARGLKTHLDGARLLNASVALDVAPAVLTAGFDSVTLCLSKGLGCPFGALLGVRADLEKTARRIKQRLGGALRQAGMAAAAGLHALDHHVERLREDHGRAARLAEGLRGLRGVEVEPVRTNLVYFRVGRGAAEAQRFLSVLEERGVRMGHAGGNRIRACLHLDITDVGLAAALDACAHATGSL